MDLAHDCEFIGPLTCSLLIQISRSTFASTLLVLLISPVRLRLLSTQASHKLVSVCPLPLLFSVAVPVGWLFRETIMFTFQSKLQAGRSSLFPHWESGSFLPLLSLAVPASQPHCGLMLTGLPDSQTPMAHLLPLLNLSCVLLVTCASFSSSCSLSA